MAAGSIVIDLLMKTGAFETDTARAEKRLQAFQKRAEEIGKTIGTVLAAGAVAAVAAFELLVKSAADFKDFEETIGASAQDIASLSIAAATAGVSMESVTGATVKLTKGLTGVDDESKAAGAALAALGLNVEDFKRLDPVAQYEAVGKALSGFADGASKTAVALALFGKSGAEQLRVFKALDEAGGRQVILTQEQIELADAFADKQAKQTATIKAYAQAAATDVLPALNELTQVATQLVKEFAGIDDAGKKLAGESPVKQFATTAVDALAFVIDAGQGVARVFQLVGNGIAARGAQIAAVLRGEFSAAAAIGKDAEEQAAAIMNSDLFSQRLAKTRAANANAAALGEDPETKRLLARSRAGVPQLNFNGAQTPDKGGDKTSEADRYLEALRKQVQKTEELTEVEKVLEDIVAGRFKGAKDFQAAQALALADEIDRGKLLIEQNKQLVQEAEDLERASNKLREAGKSVFDATRTPAEVYAQKLEEINVLLQAGAISTDTYARAVAQLQDQFDENAKRMKSIAQGINQSLEGSFTSSFADFITGAASAKDAFSSFAKSVINDLARIAAQDLAKSLFKSGDNGAGGLGGALAGLFGGGSSSSGGTGFGTGSNFGNQDYGAFLAEGTNYVPYDGFKATLHKGESVQPAKYNPAAGGAGRGTKIEVVNPPGVPLQARASEEQQPDGSVLRRLILSTVADDFKKGGQVSTAAGGTFGLRRQLARRGS